MARFVTMVEKLPEAEQPSTRKKERAALWVVGIVVAIVIVIFLGRNIGHGEELNDDQEAGNNVAQSHVGQTHY